ncbi:hypothetical protein Thiowin_00995 [Thiorhodovibrio winogradskyi]|uniref:DUF721 domain-containing protein n=1 Tax=Thiorhodovibrio winogradskyi TaxID=77007 RepID=A0ABZ0S6X2_9GAMM|nr:DciA family protein [Thiorhodovibrio winogradskyi]
MRATLVSRPSVNRVKGLERRLSSPSPSRNQAFPVSANPGINKFSMLKKLRPTAKLAGPDRETALASVLRELKQREQLLRTIKPLLPEGVRRHCSQASTDGDCLQLFADSPVWAAKLRLFTHQILNVLSEQGLTLKQCQVRVSPPLFVGNGPQGHRHADSHTTLDLDGSGDHDQKHGVTGNPKGRLSAIAASHLKQAASAISDERIAACFERIAHHHGQHALE